MSSQQWWRHAVIYQVYPRSWADADGDGMGDLPGITSRLPHLRDLGIDAIWLSPFYTSPQHDAGYDVADYRDVDPRFGTLADADAMIARAHELGLRIIVDIVPNHSSSDHVWFTEALAAAPGSRERARYIFRDGKGPDGAEPPNNWISNFGGPAWTRVTEADGSPGQWYLHLFDVTQPDFDWDNPEVGDEMERNLRFWLDRGVDGFRIDVAHGMVKAEGLPDDAVLSHEMVGRTSDHPMWDQPGVHDIYRRWRTVTDSYARPGEDADRILCAEAWVTPAEALAAYVRPDELHQGFNFPFLVTPWLAPALRASITDSLAAVAPHGAVQTWVLSNHDVVRHASRLGFEPTPGPSRMGGIGPGDPQPDAELGLRRARAATAMMLALPGSAYLYQGEELGLPEATELPDEVRQDPTWFRSEQTQWGRDGCRVPMPWEGDAPSYGFGPTEASWLPQPAAYGELAVDRQTGVEGSTLELYRTLLRLRREHGLGVRELSWVEDAGDPEHVVAFDLTAAGRPAVRVLTNVGGGPVDLPAGEVLVSSTEVGGSSLPADATVWMLVEDPARG
ncbi:glycoside hydrolase family 13 protein [Nocardioides aurantiacus]|uniref:Alpha-glucosidase n=1 Tax=Nocardioides aurantiacus TaxID=86796 RepID=A0A3N2CWX5_9ACTN|nr:glycoside hydrolase family 13 protein [Nocardioides aurantiacus]ROR91938.1 alpha-glucosidase [Nocardioides aurantiacus]